MIRIRLTPNQREELGQASQAIDSRVARRARMVLLSDQGCRVREIAQMHHISEETVRTWLQRYQQGGVAGLADHPYGRPRGS